MKKALLIISVMPIAAFCQLNVTYQINTSEAIRPISQYIYGMCNGGYDNATIRRQGGNRMTGYNWENNASNAGNDYFHQNDNYLPWNMGIPSALYDQPGIVTTAFHDSAQAHGAIDAVTLQMAGYVAKDKNGTTVETWEAAPGNRWVEVVNHKPGIFSLTPDVNDNYVYMDEYLNFLINQYGNAGTSTGVKAYILDNEAALWTSTHPRLYGTTISATDHLLKSLALARTVRGMDANAWIFGPEAYGYSEYLNFQSAADWSVYSGQYSHYLALYLDSMQQASAADGNRLLDVMTVHWYPDVYAGSIFSTDASPAIARERMQVPRSLWDSTYVENGWIGQWFSEDLPILPKLKSLINTYYPGTKLGITEYDYGGDAHISGGIAQVEALGAFARTGTEYATKWGAFSDYSLSAVQLFRDIAEPFGNQYIYSASSDRAHSSAFGSMSGNDDSELHLVVTNKSMDSTINAQFNITAASDYDSIRVYYFTQGNTAIQVMDLPATILQPGGFSYTLQPLTVYHFVLKTAQSTSGTGELVLAGTLSCFPNPAKEQLTVQSTSETTASTLTITNLLGQTVQRVAVAPKTPQTVLDLQLLIPGTYFLRHETPKGIRQVVFMKE
jgi:mannan endo-1,4-beta-mannosidase